MLIRLWRSGFDMARLGELKHFANNFSLPMFHRQRGCRGVLFYFKDEIWITQSAWTDQGAIDALADSADYQNTVVRINAMGFLRAPQSVEVWTMAGADLAISGP